MILAYDYDALTFDVCHVFRRERALKIMFDNVQIEKYVKPLESNFVLEFYMIHALRFHLVQEMYLSA